MQHLLLRLQRVKKEKKVTHRPPQTYFLTSQTPATALVRRIAMTTMTMRAVFVELFSICSRDRKSLNMQRSALDSSAYSLYVISEVSFHAF